MSPRPRLNETSEMKRARIYLHPLRRKVMDYLEKEGPSTQTEIARALDMAPASASFHLRQLSRGGFARSAGTRPGPKGIVERLFKLPARRKDMGFRTPHGSTEDRLMRKVALDEVIETHRVGSRIILREPTRYFALASYEAMASASELRQLNRALRGALAEFARGHPIRRVGKDTEPCRIQLGFYPQHPTEKGALP